MKTERLKKLMLWEDLLQRYFKGETTREEERFMLDALLKDVNMILQQQQDKTNGGK